MLTVFQYSKCSTCRKALKWLEAAGISYDAVDITSEPPTARQLAEVLKLTGLPVAKLFNTSGVVYREGNYKERLKTMSQTEALAELTQCGKLIKRPLLLGKKLALIGFKEADYESQLGG